MEQHDHNWIRFQTGFKCNICGEKKFPEWRDWLIARFPDVIQGQDVTDFLLNAGETQRQQLTRQFHEAKSKFDSQIEKNEKVIVDYCVEKGITIPPGFWRNSQGHLSIIRVHISPPKLVGITWSSHGEVVSFIKKQLIPELGDSVATHVQILDFQTGERFAYNNGNSQLERVGTFHNEGG